MNRNETGPAGWTVFDDLNDNGLRDPYSHLTVESEEVPLPAPDLGTVASSLTVSGLAGTLIDVNVGFTVYHEIDRDVVLYLISPDGAAVTLVNEIGGTGDNYVNTTVDDQASSPITAGTASRSAAGFAPSHRWRTSTVTLPMASGRCISKTLTTT